MQKFIYKIISFILNIQQSHHEKRMQQLSLSIKNGTSKHSFHGANELILSAETELKKEELEQKVKTIVKQNINKPEELLNFIKDQGTDVFRLKSANIFLKLINEDEGFITPANGFKALLINLYINLANYNKLTISFKSNGMFILRPLPVDIYYMIHQFHKWYSYELGLPGFDFKSQQNFKKIFKTLSQEDITNLSLEDIISLKESIARDVEAIDFVVNLSKEYDTSKKLLNRIKAGNSINL